MDQSQPFARYSSIIERREGLLAAQQSMPDLTLYATAIDNANRELSQLEQDPDVAMQLRKLVGPFIGELQQADRAIDQAVSLAGDLLSETDIAEQRAQVRGSIEQRLSSDPVLKAAWKFVSSTAMVASGVVIIEDVPAANATTSPAAVVEQHREEVVLGHETQRPPLTITRQGDAVLIGKGGKFIRLSDARSDEQRDYSEERWSVLETMAKNPGKELSANELWDQTFPGREFDGHTMSQIRDWLKKLTYRHSPLIIHNGKRGVGSRYTLNNFVLTLQKITKPVTIKPVEVIPESSLTHVSAKPKEASPKCEATEKTIAPFPLSLFESSVVAAFLFTSRRVFEARGITPIDEKLTQNISNGIDDQRYEREQAIAYQAYGDIRGVREEAIKKLAAFFNSEEAVLANIDAMPKQDHRYELFNYLMEIENQDRWDLLNEMLGAKLTTEAKGDLPKYGGTQIGPVTRHALTQRGGDLMIPDPEVKDVETIPLERPEEQPMAPAETPGLPLQDSIDTTPSSTSAYDLDPSSDLRIEQATPEVQAVTLEQEVAAIRSEVKKWIRLIEEMSLVNKPARTIRNIFPWFTEKVVGTASERGGILHRDGGKKSLKMDEILMVNISNQYSEAYSRSQSSRSRITRNTLRDIVETELKAFDADKDAYLA